MYSDSLSSGSGSRDAKKPSRCREASEELSKPSCDNLFDEDHTAFFALDRSYRYLDFNRLHADFMKMLSGKDIAVGALFSDYVEGPDLKRAYRSFDRALRGEKFIEVIEMNGPANEELAFEVMHRPLRDPSDNIIGVMLAARDVTRKEGAQARHCMAKSASAKEDSKNSEAQAIQLALLRRLERSRAEQAETLFEKTCLISRLNESMQRLEASNAIKDKLFSIVAHDLRSPFHAFLNLLRTVREELPLLRKREVLEYIDLLHGSATGMHELIENLLEWATLQEGKIQVLSSICNVRNAVESAVRLFENPAASKGVSLHNNVCPGPDVYADPHMLGTVLRNLLGNEIKFTKKGGHIEIEAANGAAEGFIEIRVSDNGVGIPADIMPHLFSADRKTGRPGTDGEASSGLGLILCKEFVVMHGGSISVNSREGAGTTVLFTLPCGEIADVATENIRPKI